MIVAVIAAVALHGCPGDVQVRGGTIALRAGRVTANVACRPARATIRAFFRTELRRYSCATAAHNRGCHVGRWRCRVTGTHTIHGSCTSAREAVRWVEHDADSG